MIKCGINKLYLLLIVGLLALYLWFLAHGIINKNSLEAGILVFPTLIFTVPIYFALFQIKTVKIDNGQLIIFYPFRFWTNVYQLSDLDKWKYKKTTKVIRLELFLKSRYVIIKFKDSPWLTVLFSLTLTNFDGVLDYLNHHHKNSRSTTI